MKDPFLKVEKIILKYKDGHSYFTALDEVAFTLPRNGLFTITGPSGSGKSSLLYVLSGLKRHNSGTIKFDQRYIPGGNFKNEATRRRYSGFLFQQHFLINYLNVEQNISTGYFGNDKKEKAERFRYLLAKLDIERLTKRKPFELSGGQKQRVALARALMNNPMVIFADEPTASLDHKNGTEVIKLLKDFSKSSCVIISTHDEKVAKEADINFKMLDGKLWD